MKVLSASRAGQPAPDAVTAPPVTGSRKARRVVAVGPWRVCGDDDLGVPSSALSGWEVAVDAGGDGPVPRRRVPPELGEHRPPVGPVLPAAVELGQSEA